MKISSDRDFPKKIFILKNISNNKDFRRTEQ